MEDGMKSKGRQEGGLSISHLSLDRRAHSVILPAWAWLWSSTKQEHFK